jgi:hypothetical protein
MSDVWYCVNDSDTGDWVTSIWDGLGIPAAQIPSIGTSGPAYLFNDIASQGASETDEFYSVMLTVPPVGTFTHTEYSAISFAGSPDGIHTATYEGYLNGVSYGQFAITMIIGESAIQLASTNATLLTVGYAIAQSEAKNRQLSATAADVISNTTAQATTKITNSQHQQSTGQVVSVARFIASTSWINSVSIENQQHIATSATLRQVARASAQATPNNSQRQQTAGQASTAASFLATTSWMNKILIVAAYVSYIKTRSITKKAYKTSTRRGTYAGD